MGQNAGDIIVAPGDPNRQVFTASGTWTKPAGMRGALIEVIGGGGGSGGVAFSAAGQTESGGGGGGGYSAKLFLDSELGATEAVVVGAGGAAGASGNNAGVPAGPVRATASRQPAVREGKGRPQGPRPQPKGVSAVSARWATQTRRARQATEAG